MKEITREISNLRLLCSKDKFDNFETAFAYSQIILENIVKAPRTQVYDDSIYFLIREGKLIPARPFIGHTRFDDSFEILDTPKSDVKGYSLVLSEINTLNLSRFECEDRPYLLFRNTETGPEVRIEWFLTN